MITFTQVKYLIEVVDKMSISKAAASMFITQSAMSRQIALLESEIGVKLFKRENRMITLTPAGKTIYDCFVRMQEDYERSVSNAVLQEKEGFEKIVVGAFDQANIYTMYADIFEQFFRDHPNLEVQYFDYDLGDLWDLFQSDKIDVMITLKESLYSCKGLYVRDLCTITRGLLCSREHPIARKEGSLIRDLNGEKLILTQEASLQPYYRKMMAQLEQSGAKMEPVYVPNFNTLLQKVRRNEGFMIMDNMGQYDYYKELHHVSLENIFVTICVVSKRKTRAILSLIDAVSGRDNPYKALFG